MSDTSFKFPYVDRDVSWMYFNHRILKEAERDDVPLLERVMFLGIYSNNLDEFFRVRMAALSRTAELKGKDVHEDRVKAEDLFYQISTINSNLADEYASCVKTVERELAAAGIRIVNENELSEEQEHFVRSLFRKKISGFVSPVWLSKLEQFSEESDSHIYLGIELSGEAIKTDYALIELPTSTCGRFVSLPAAEGENYVMYLDDIIRYCLPMIFPGMGYSRFKAYSFKFTKDAEIDIDNDMRAGLLERIQKAVKNRKKGAALRVQYDAEMPQEMLNHLMKKLKLDALDTVQQTGRYQNHKDFMSFPSQCRPELKYSSWPPQIPAELKGTESLMKLVEEKDRFVHVPYQTFDYVIRLLQEAAVSKNVKSIKMTLYRLARNSKIAEALMCAARNGKKVTAVVELMARFDESSNISYARKMQEAGVNVVFGLEGLKIHSKIALISVKSGHNIAIVGTGNFHEGNASAYTDYFLMTADPKIVENVRKVFDIIKRPYNPQIFHGMLVSPFNMRDHFYHLIDQEIENARQGKEAWIKVKINHITDHGMVERLYKASQAGVRIEMLVRGNCSLVTGVPGLSENISIAGIIDRYLEHSRIFIFHAGGENLTFMGSADWMPRNLDRRIEVVTRVFDEDLKADLLRTVEFGLRDNTNAYVVDGTGTDELRVIPEENERFRSQQELYQAYQKKQ